MKIKLTPVEISNVKSSSEVFRAFPLISIDLANKVNMWGIAVLPFIKKLESTTEIIKERTISTNLISDTKEKEAAIKLLNEDIAKENKKTFEVDFITLKASDFAKDGKQIEIIGDKEVTQQNGKIVKHNYRDAYFTLVNMGLIV